MKKILFLGAAHTQIPPILYAKMKGYKVYTVDNRPENPGHALADKSFNISTINADAILSLSKKLGIDAIIAYASDPAAPTAAFVSEALNLIGNPPQSVDVLTNKSKFRQFLDDNGFFSPKSLQFNELNKAEAFAKSLTFPLFVKPVDSSGSKGVSKIANINLLPAAFDKAIKFSISNHVILEEQIPRATRQIDSDIFMSDGEIIFWVWGDQRQDPVCHEHAPIAISFPSQLDQSIQLKAKSVVENILSKLNFRTGAFNVEYLVDEHENIWIIEIGPRNGGNLIPEVIHLSTGANMIEWTVEAALGNQIPKFSQIENFQFASSYLIHAQSDGVYDGLYIDRRIEKKIFKKDIFVKKGAHISRYDGSNTTLGTMILQFESALEMEWMMDRIEDLIKVKVK